MNKILGRDVWKWLNGDDMSLVGRFNLLAWILSLMREKWSKHFVVEEVHGLVVSA